LDEFWRYLDQDVSGDVTRDDLIELGYSEKVAQDMYDFLRVELNTSAAKISGPVYIAALRNDAIKIEPNDFTVGELVKTQPPPSHQQYVQAVVNSLNQILVQDVVKGWCKILLPDKEATLGTTPPADNRFWQLNPQDVALPEMSASLYLYEETRQTIERLFGLLDQDKSGDITIQDFLVAGLDAATAQAKWQIIAGLDVDGSHSIDVEELIEGLKRYVTTQPVNPSFWSTGKPRNHVQCISWTNASLNDSIVKLCTSIVEQLRK